MRKKENRMGTDENGMRKAETRLGKALKYGRNPSRVPKSGCVWNDGSQTDEGRIRPAQTVTASGYDGKGNTGVEVRRAGRKEAAEASGEIPHA
jgi:hypothetical protein